MACTPQLLLGMIFGVIALGGVATGVYYGVHNINAQYSTPAQLPSPALPRALAPFASPALSSPAVDATICDPATDTTCTVVAIKPSPAVKAVPSPAVSLLPEPSPVVVPEPSPVPVEVPSPAPVPSPVPSPETTKKCLRCGKKCCIDFFDFED